jgi:hypothetical protein
MTWIIGSPTPFGYVMGLSDIQVTWGTNGPRHDCLRKVYEVAPFVAAGFAGSVSLGFRLLEDLVQFLSPPPEPGECWIPRWVALKWCRRARRIYENRPDVERQLGSSIILMGVRPTDNSGCINGGHPDVIILSAKHGFAPEFFDLGAIGSIGSGNNVELYMNELKALQLNFWPNMHAEIGQPGGMGRAWVSSLSRLLLGNPAPGISPYLHHILVWRDRVQIQPLNMSKISADGNKTDYQMPEVVSGWTQFIKFAENVGLSTAEARA